nr:head-tail connector protein [Brucella anthropi]
MADLVSLQEVKNGLRIDTDDDDAHLNLLISAASGRVKAYLDVRADEVIDENGATTDARVKAAVIMLVGYYYRNPDQDPDKDFSVGMLPKPVSSMLYQLRDPIAR